MSEQHSVPFKVAIIGCGKPRNSEEATGFGMSHQHMFGYAKTGKCELVAVADIVRENGEAFVAIHNPEAKVYEDYVEMMEEETPDIVSVSLWPHLHAQVVCRLAELKPKIIFCEKPMDLHWDASLKMHKACKDNGVTLIINHQRRFNLPLLKAKEMLDGGEIGKLLRVEGAWGNLSDAGTHALDMMFYYNNDTAAQWVMGQIEMRSAKKFFGAIQAGQGVTEFRFENGVRAIFYFGDQHEDFDFLIRLYGEKGMIEILNNEPWLRVMKFGGTGEWEAIDTGENIHEDVAVHRAVAEFIECFENGKQSMLDSDNALRATEIIFATHESSKRRARVDLPLEPGPCAMISMIESGEISGEHETII